MSTSEFAKIQGTDQIGVPEPEQGKENARKTVNQLVVYLFNDILALEERSLRKEGVTLTMSEVHLLEAIRDIPGNTMSEIARRLMVTQGTLSTAVRRMVSKGYIARVPDEKDRRIFHLELQKKARGVLAVHDAFHHDMIERAVDSLAPEEMPVLIETLQNLIRFFDEHYEPQD